MPFPTQPEIRHQINQLSHQRQQIYFTTSGRGMTAAELQALDALSIRIRRLWRQHTQCTCGLCDCTGPTPTPAADDQPPAPRDRPHYTPRRARLAFR